MFPSKGKHFSDLVCPDIDTCKLSPCLFTHSASAGNAAKQPTPTASTSKQPLVSALKKRPASNESLSVEEFDANRKKALKTSSMGSGLGRSAQPAASTSKLSAAVAAASAAPTSVAGGPKLVHTGPCHTALAVRQKMVTALYQQFMATYAKLTNATKLASAHALTQERTIFNSTNKVTYRNGVMLSLSRLKKRPLAVRESEAGTLEDEAERIANAAEREKGRLTPARVERYLAPIATLEKYGYFTSVPEQEGGTMETEEGNVRKCERCGTEYLVKGKDADKNACSYHFGKLAMHKIGGQKHRVWTCCPTPEATTCQQGPHVFRDDSIDVLHSRVGFMTSEDACGGRVGTLDIVALDCEMVYTTAGLTLARVTVLDEQGDSILDERVIPQGTVLDLNTRFSGVTESDLAAATLDTKAVRSFLGRFVGPETIIVGHGLENDLKALRIVHNKVIDTAILFPHPAGPPFRLALRNLTREYLGKFIQEGDPSLGHSAEDDSKAALELVRWKLKQDTTKR